MQLGAEDWIHTRSLRWCSHLNQMEALLEPITQPLISALKIDGPCQIADIGCGGGDVALEIERTSPPGSVITGFDVAPTMIEAANKQARELNRSARFAVANAETWLPEHPIYQRLCSRFGVMFFADPEVAFTNLRHWLSPQGRFAFAVWSDPADNTWSSTVVDVVSSLIDIPESEPDAPGPFRYQDSTTFIRLLEKAGFQELNCQTWNGELPMGGKLSPAEAADFALSGFGIGQKLAEAGEEAFQTGTDILAKRFEPFYRHGSVWMSASVHLVRGCI